MFSLKKVHPETTRSERLPQPTLTRDQLKLDKTTFFPKIDKLVSQ